MTQIKWFIIALIVAFVLVSSFENIAFTSGTFFEAQNTFLGLNLFLEILIFLVFSIFVVFGIKGYFEFYSKKISNIIISVSGSVLFLGILILLSQILLQEWVINKIISFTKKKHPSQDVFCFYTYLAFLDFWIAFKTVIIKMSFIFRMFFWMQ